MTSNSAVVVLPPVSITQGLPFYLEMVFKDIDGPVDLSGWTGTFALSVKPFDEPFFSIACDLDENGVIRVQIEGTSTDTFDAPERIGGGPFACYQIFLSAPSSEFDQIWQGTANIAGRF